MNVKGNRTGRGPLWSRGGRGRVSASRIGGRRQRGPGRFSSTNAPAATGGPRGRTPGPVRVQKRNLT
jgi:hypothetical protein